jgi:hypothetical protein
VFSGGATSANSGFTGEQGWDNDPDLLTNSYYKELLKFDQFSLTLEENAQFPPFPDQWYWEEEETPGVSGVFMLQADMALAFDMEGYLNPANGNVNCTIVPLEGQTLCPMSPLRARAEFYRDNNLLWVQAFEAAFIKMINTGCGNGVCKVRAPAISPVSSLAVVDMVLYNADTDRPIMSLMANNGATLSQKAIGTSNWSIVAVTNHPGSDPKTGSVKFGYDNVAGFRYEEVAPWAIAGDDSKGNYYSWTPTLGKHTVTATPYSLDGARQPGKAQTVSFTVVA